MTGVNRREFLKRSTLAGGYCLAGGAALPQGARVAIVSDPDDPVASAPPASWAISELEKALAARGASVERLPRLPARGNHDLRVIVAGAQQSLARPMLQRVTLPQAPESLAIVPGQVGGQDVLLVSGRDPRGLMYAVLEIADRVQYSADPLPELRLRQPVVEQPANRIRAISRLFASDVEDKPWYNDRAFWPPYLSMLAAQRFNRFALTFGLAYDFTNHITDCYFHFAYPFLLAVPGYHVHAVGLPDAERDHNLEMLRYISEQTIARGMDFQLGLWTHAYQWTDSPHANYTISGLTPETHAAYCREALRLLLQQCPAIGSVVLRIHGESGVAEGSYSFWETVMSGVAASGRNVEINLHAKGLDQRLLDIALATGMPISVAPKYWAEHMGLAYHQASIREQEKPRQASGFFALSSGSRQFLRYSYGDLLVAGRRYEVYSRMWPGTQRVLLWGDPVTAAAYGRASSFAGQAGADLFEPLSFKGRRGSGLPGGRCAYADASLNPQYDWQKFAYGYRLWGRLLYNPEADAATWRRYLAAEFRSAATEVEQALASASRILPLVTTAHAPSAANNTYWPEMYTNMADVETGRRGLYVDTPSHKVFGYASSFDPQLFARVDDFAHELLTGDFSGKHSPVEVAAWLEGMADTATQHLSAASAQIGKNPRPEFRRLAIDVAMQAGLGRFFAAKFRSGVLYSIFEKTGDPGAWREALRLYRAARDAWAGLSRRAEGIYMADVTYGPEPNLRGHWLNRLQGIDDDIAAMGKKQGQPPAASATYPGEQIQRAVQAALGKPVRRQRRWSHIAPRQFRPGEDLPIEVALREPAGSDVTVRLQYRHVNQAEEYQEADMTRQGSAYRAVVPAAYTQSPYGLQYYFVARAAATAWLLPGFDPNAPQQPYYFVPRTN